MGKVCNRDTGRCKAAKATAGKKAAGKKGKGASKRPSRAKVEEAIYANVGSQTAASLAYKRKSSKLGAGMDTMVELTRKKMKSKKASKTSKKTTKKASKKTTKTLKKTSGQCPSCPNPKRPLQDLSDCKCYAKDSAAARMKGVCAPRRGKDGKMY